MTSSPLRTAFPMFTRAIALVAALGALAVSPGIRADVIGLQAPLDRAVARVLAEIDDVGVIYVGAAAWGVSCARSCADAAREDLTATAARACAQAARFSASWRIDSRVAHGDRVVATDGDAVQVSEEGQYLTAGARADGFARTCDPIALETFVEPRWFTCDQRVYCDVWELEPGSAVAP